MSDRQLPTITVQQETDEYVLMVTSYLRTNVAGERLFRAQPHPDIKFRHATLAAAEKDAATLTAYLLDPPKRRRKKSEMADAVEAKEVVITDAVWMI